MNEGLIPRRYAKALFLVAREKGLEKSIYDLMKRAEVSFAQMPDLSVTLENPYIPVGDKTRLIQTAAGVKPGESRLFDDFIKLLVENRRIGFMRLVALAYVELYREENHIYNVSVTSAAPISEKDSERLRNFVEKHLDGGTIEYTSTVDPTLIGGFTVSVGNERIDASVSNELKQLRLSLLSK